MSRPDVTPIVMGLYPRTERDGPLVGVPRPGWHEMEKALAGLGHSILATMPD